MVIASGPVQTTQVPAAVVGDIDESIMTEQAKKALQKVEEGIRKEREQWEDTGEEAGDENVDGGVTQSGIGRVYAISDEANEHHKLLLRQWSTSTKAAIKKEKVGGSDVPLQMALDSAVVEGKDGEVWHTDQVLSKEFRKDRVNNSRDRRFWVSKLPDWQVAVAEGHATTYGTCFIVKWSTINRFAVVRVRAMYVEKTIAHSLKWNASDKKQSFHVEVLTPEKEVETHSQLYATTGFYIGPIVSSFVLQIVELLRSPDGSSNGLLVVDEIRKLKTKKLTQIVVDEGLLQLEVAKISGSGKNRKVTLHRVEGWGQSPCSRCRSSWFDSKKGCLVLCQQCKRVFHQSCYKPKIKNTEKENWLCQVMDRTSISMASKSKILHLG